MVTRIANLPSIHDLAAIGGCRKTENVLLFIGVNPA